MLSGGRGDDVLIGGAGDDVVYSGAGADVVLGGGGDDTLYGQGEDTAAGVERMVAVPSSGGLDGFVRIEGDAEFVERVQADLDLLSASPDGRQMLAALQATATPVVIQPEPGDNGHARPGPRPAVLYNPAWSGVHEGRPPVVTLFHELAHVYDFTRGTVNGQAYNGASGRDSTAPATRWATTNGRRPGCRSTTTATPRRPTGSTRGTPCSSPRTACAPRCTGAPGHVRHRLEHRAGDQVDERRRWRPRPGR